MNEDQKRLMHLALSLDYWADVWPKNLRVKNDVQPWIEMRLESKQIRERFGEGKEGSKWERWLREDLC